MAPDELLFVLRILSALLLYTFLFFALRASIGRIQFQTMKNIEASQKMPYVLVVETKGDEQRFEEGEVLFLVRNTTIGRSRTNTIIMESPFVSTLHASLSYENKVCWLIDHESRNGTHLNDSPISQKTALAPGDRIRIGQTEFILTFREDLPVDKK